MVEFVRNESGVSIMGREGKWLPVPVEYKHGDGEAKEADELQLCAQAMCLEGMLCCDIPEGNLYYAEVRRRMKIPLTPELRARVEAMLEEMHRLYTSGYTPRVKKRPGCKSCSLREICLPELEKTRTATAYLTDILREAEDITT